MSDTPVSLYLDLEEGKTPDIEVVARAALAFSSAIKEIAWSFDPFAEVRVELESGEEGSLDLRARIKAVRGHLNKKTLKAIGLGILLYITFESRDWLADKALDALFGGDRGDQPATKDDIDELKKLIEGGVAKPQVQQMYRELERDPVIKGVGVSTVHGAKPAAIVPRSAFATRGGGGGNIREETITRRVVPTTERVSIIKPVLLEGERRWSLKTAHGEFGFVMKDKDFVVRVLSGTTPVPMVAGLELDVQVETTEEFKGGVWHTAERSVVRVLGLHRPPRQASLFLGPGDDDADEDQDETDGGQPPR